MGDLSIRDSSLFLTFDQSPWPNVKPLQRTYPLPMVSINFHMQTPVVWLRSGDLDPELRNSFNETDSASLLIKFARANNRSNDDELLLLTNAEGLEIPTDAPWTVKHIIEELPNNQHQHELFIVRASEGIRLCHEGSDSNIEEEVCDSNMEEAEEDQKPAATAAPEAKTDGVASTKDRMNANVNDNKRSIGGNMNNQALRSSNGNEGEDKEDEDDDEAKTDEEAPDIPYDMVVRSPLSDPVWAIHSVESIHAWSTVADWEERLDKSTKWLPTYGNCGICFSCGPLGSICPRCSDKKNFTPNLELKQVRFAMLYIDNWTDPPARDNNYIHHQVKSIVDADQFANTMYQSHCFTKHFKSQEVCQEVWPPIEPQLFPAKADRTVFWTNRTPCETLFDDKDMLNKLNEHSDFGGDVFNLDILRYIGDFRSIQLTTKEKVLELLREKTKLQQTIIKEEEAYLKETKEIMRNAKLGE